MKQQTYKNLTCVCCKRDFVYRVELESRYALVDMPQGGKGIEDIPFVAIGNDELGESIGETTICQRCGKRHKVEYGEKINKDGTKTPSKMLGFVKCGEKSYLVSIDGKGIK